MVLLPVAAAALAGAPALTVVLVGGAAYLLVSYAGSEAGKAVYDVLRLGAESLSKLMSGSEDTSGSDPPYRGYTQESDGTITMYETYQFGREMRIYTHPLRHLQQGDLAHVLRAGELWFGGALQSDDLAAA